MGETRKNLWRVKENEQYRRKTNKELCDIYQAPGIVQCLKAQRIR